MEGMRRGYEGVAAWGMRGDLSRSGAAMAYAAELIKQCYFQSLFPVKKSIFLAQAQMIHM